MPDTAVNRRKGTTAEHATAIGVLAETSYDTDLKRLVAHDGATPGGFPAAMLHVANIFSQPQTIAVLSGGPTDAFDILVDGLSRFMVRKTGFVAMHRQEADTSPSSFELTKRGTTGNALAALSSGSGVGAMFVRGYDGTAFGDAGSIRVFTTQAWAPGAHGTQLIFATVPIGSTVETTHATLSSTAFEVMSRLLLPNTTSATIGGIYFNSIRAIHNFGTQNWFSGVGAGNLTLTGADNTSAGFGTLAALTSGARNVAVGLNALAALTTATNNVAVGSGALAIVTTGGSNVGVGRNALSTLVSGTHNTAVGVSSLTIATGNDNTGVGSNSLAALSTGLRNTAVGRQALMTLSTTSDSVAVGYFALNLATGANNTATGASALSLVNTGANNLGFGYQAGNNLTTGSNNIIIGYDIDSPTATNSNTLTLGNIIFGTGLDGTGTTISSGFVGIKVVTPVTELHVVTTSAADPRGIMSAQHSTDAIAARIHFRKSRGAATAPTTIVTGDFLGRLRFSGYDSANYLQMGCIDVVSVGTIAATRVPTYMAFSTATDATPSVLTEGFRLTQLQTLLMATGKALAMASGANQRAGNAVLVGGTVTVANTSVTANTIVMLTRKTSGGTVGTVITYTVIAATSFTITSDSVLDTSTFSYLLIEVP